MLVRVGQRWWRNDARAPLAVCRKDAAYLTVLNRFSPGTTAQFWLNLQTAFDLRRAELEAGKDIAKIRPFKATG